MFSNSRITNNITNIANRWKSLQRRTSTSCFNSWSAKRWVIIITLAEEDTITRDNIISSKIRTTTRAITIIMIIK